MEFVESGFVENGFVATKSKESIGFVEDGFVESGFVESLGQIAKIKIKTLIYPLKLPRSVMDSESFISFISSKIVRIENDLLEKESESIKYVAYIVSKFGSEIIPSKFLQSRGFSRSSVGAGIDRNKVVGIFWDEYLSHMQERINRDVDERIEKLFLNLNENQLNIIANKVIEIMEINNVATINYSPTIGNVTLFKQGETITIPFERNADGSLHGKISLNGEYDIIIGE